MYRYSIEIVNKDLDFNEVLYNLLSNKKKLSFLGSNAKKRVIEEFTWNHISNKYLLLINKLTKEN